MTRFEVAPSLHTDFVAGTCSLETFAQPSRIQIVNGWHLEGKRKEGTTTLSTPNPTPFKLDQPGPSNDCTSNDSVESSQYQAGIPRVAYSSLVLADNSRYLWSGTCSPGLTEARKEGLRAAATPHWF
jgi:hypothetical protein